MAEKQAKQSQPSMATLSPKMQAYLDTQTQADEQVAERSTTSAEELEIIDTLISFPYWYGPGLVGSLYEQGGWATVNTAYSSPPQTTEQILHPDRYLAGEQPQVVDLPLLSDVLGVG